MLRSGNTEKQQWSLGNYWQSFKHLVMHICPKVSCAENPGEQISANLSFNEKQLLPKIQYDTRDNNETGKLRTSE